MSMVSRVMKRRIGSLGCSAGQANLAGRRDRAVRYLMNAQTCDRAAAFERMKQSEYEGVVPPCDLAP